jgi:hypothetical protein
MPDKSRKKDRNKGYDICSSETFIKVDKFYNIITYHVGSRAHFSIIQLQSENDSININR